MVLRASLADAVAVDELHRNPAARVAMPRDVYKPSSQHDPEVWTEDQIRSLLEAIGGHRWEGPSG